MPGKKITVKELDVDYIGGMGPLSKEDEKAISDFIQAQKKKQVSKKSRRTTASKTKTRIGKSK